MTETPTLTPPDDRKTFKVNKEDFKVFMSFQRLNSLLRIIETGDNLPLVTLDPDLSEPMIRALLSPTTQGQYEIDLDKFEIENEVYEEMIVWCRDHLINFFMKQLRLTADQEAAMGPAVKALQSQLLGSVASTSEPVPAGPSA